MNIGSELRKKLDNITDQTRIGWDLKRKMKLIYNPEAKCPYCNEWFHTRRVWLINDETNHIRGCWNLDGSSIPADKIIHPHAWMNGEVCLGTYKSASEALFAGIDKGKHVHYVPRWLVQLGHDCDKLPYTVCPVCTGKYFSECIEDFIFGYREVNLCSDECLKIAQAFRCEGCLDVLGLERKNFCNHCEERLFVNCTLCQTRELEVTTFCYTKDYLKCCYECYRTKLRGCIECGYMMKIEELNRDDLCEVCVTLPVRIQCSQCGGRCLPENLVDGICNYCRNYCGECECSPCECEPEPDPFYIEEEEEEEEIYEI